MANIDELVRTVVEYNAPGAGIAQNIFYHKVAGNEIPDGDLLDELAQWVGNDWGGAWSDIGADSAEISLINVDIVNDDGTIARNIGAALVNVTGGALGGVLPAANAGYIKADTAFPKVSGKKYIPFAAESQVDNGLWSPEALGDLAILLLLFSGNIDVGTATVLRPGVISKSLAKFEAFNGAGLLQDLPAYQRRRKDGVGI